MIMYLRNFIQKGLRNKAVFTSLLTVDTSSGFNQIYSNFHKPLRKVNLIAQSNYSNKCICLKNYKSISSLRSYGATALQNETDTFRNDNKVTIVGKDCPDPIIHFGDVEFPPYIVDYLKKKNFEKPTVIQAQGWPVVMQGKNLVGIAQTGTGKTLGYLLPAIIHVKEKDRRTGKGPVALVVAPTRELTQQIYEVAKDFQRFMGIRIACLFGGSSRLPQEALLTRGVDMVIATPGRLNDFLRGKVTNLSRCTYVVLDEADRMLDMGFEPQIREIMESTPYEKQVLMWSATWPKEVQSLARDYLGEYTQINVGSTELTANHNIEQKVCVCKNVEKMETLTSILEDIKKEGFGRILIFANTKRFVDNLEFQLRSKGWAVSGIHGDKTQRMRDQVINQFKYGRCQILIATDVAARGLDVDGVTHVINYDYPTNSEDYIHRIGRTGRKDQKGTSYSILTEDNARQAKDLIEIMKEANQEIPQELITLSRTSYMQKSPQFNNYKKDKFNNYYKKDYMKSPTSRKFSRYGRENRWPSV